MIIAELQAGELQFLQREGWGRTARNQIAARKCHEHGISGATTLDLFNAWLLANRIEPIWRGPADLTLKSLETLKTLAVPPPHKMGSFKDYYPFFVQCVENLVGRARPFWLMHL